MLNQYPLWKYILIVAVLVLSTLYALPNLYGKDPALLISPLRTSQMNKEERTLIENALKQANVKYSTFENVGDKLRVRFPNTEQQLKASDILNKLLEDKFIVAQNLAAATPA